MSVLRSVVAVVGGYLIFGLAAFALFEVSGREPHAPQPVWFMACRTPSHATIVAGVLALSAIVSLLSSTGATWSQWTALIFVAPSAYVGGRLAVQR